MWGKITHKFMGLKQLRTKHPKYAGADADRVHWLGEPSQIFIDTTLFLVLRLIITV